MRAGTRREAAGAVDDSAPAVEEATSPARAEGCSGLAAAINEGAASLFSACSTIAAIDSLGGQRVLLDPFVPLVLHLLRFPRVLRVPLVLLSGTALTSHCAAASEHAASATLGAVLVLHGTPAPGGTAPVGITLEFVNGSKLEGTLEAVVCRR